MTDFTMLSRIQSLTRQQPKSNTIIFIPSNTYLRASSIKIDIYEYYIYYILYTILPGKYANNEAVIIRIL